MITYIEILVAIILTPIALGVIIAVALGLAIVAFGALDDYKR